MVGRAAILAGCLFEHLIFDNGNYPSVIQCALLMTSGSPPPPPPPFELATPADDVVHHPTGIGFPCAPQAKGGDNQFIEESDKVTKTLLAVRNMVRMRKMQKYFQFAQKILCADYQKL